ncbi:MAG TPA: Do family serine endopeptidase [Pirellulales bacterium]|nr:Do family serine endopeptidase [Pirellulales bacterium]
MRHVAMNHRRKLLIVVGLFALAAAGVPLWQVRGTAKEPGGAHGAARQNANHLSEAFRAAAEEAVPTVVTIETRSKPRQVSGMAPGTLRENPFKGTPFEDFFKDDAPFGHGFGDGHSPSHRTPQRQGMGSGVIVDKSGIVLTNNHVVDGADEVLVRLSDGREFKASDIKTDPETDLAVLRITGAGTLPAARLGNSDDLRLGDWVIAVGNPFTFESTVSAGIISGTSRDLKFGKRTRFVQTDAAINPGNSGGPLVNLDGEVIGINTAIASNSGGYQGIGFAIPSNLTQWVMSQLIETGVVQRAYLGVGIEEVSGQLAGQVGVGRHDGVLVAEVHPNTPAAEAGFQEGDVITEYAGKAVHTPGDLQETVERTPIDSRQEVKVLRDGKPIRLQVVVKPLPGKEIAKATSHDDHGRGARDDHGYKSDDLGMEVGELTANNAEQLGFKDFKGVVITGVDDDGLAADTGLREGMLIMKVGKSRVVSVADFKAAMEKESLERGVLLLVRTEHGNRFVVLEKR